MSLLTEWTTLINTQTDETFDDFWEKYSATETRIYRSILVGQNPVVTGTFKELAEKNDADPVIFMGFLDGVNTSLHKELDLESVTEDAPIALDLDWERLYFNMLKAGAEYLYTLEEWEPILTEEKRQEILKDYKRSKTVVKEREPGRNDPCPCGSGKKYKKCCGATK